MSTAGYANPAALVSTDWVAEHLNDPNVRLIEVDVDTSAYDTGHVPGAVGLNWTTQLSDQIRRERVVDRAVEIGGDCIVAHSHTFANAKQPVAQD